MNKTYISLPIIIFAFGLIAISPASAGLGATGVLYNADVHPGQNISYEINVSIAPTDPPTDIAADLLGFEKSLDGSSIGILPVDDIGPYTARPFLNVSPAKFHLDSGGWQKVLLTGTVPSDVGSGGRYALVNIHTLSKNDKSVGISYGIFVPVLLTVSGTEMRETGEITSLDVIKPISSKQQNISVIFNNTGNYHYMAGATVALKEKNGTILAENSVFHSFSSIPPMSSREFKLSLTPKEEVKPGAYNLNASVNLEDGTVLAAKEIEIKL